MELEKEKTACEKSVYIGLRLDGFCCEEYDLSKETIDRLKPGQKAFITMAGRPQHEVLRELKPGGLEITTSATFKKVEMVQQYKLMQEGLGVYGDILFRGLSFPVARLVFESDDKALEYLGFFQDERLFSQHDSAYERTAIKWGLEEPEYPPSIWIMHDDGFILRPVRCDIYYSIKPKDIVIGGALKDFSKIYHYITFERKRRESFGIKEKPLEGFGVIKYSYEEEKLLEKDFNFLVEILERRGTKAVLDELEAKHFKERMYKGD